MNNETMVYPFTEEATSKLTRLMFFGKITKIAIVQPDNKPPYLIVDHTEYVRSDEPTIDGKPNITEEKRRTAINFNDTKDENKYKDDYMYDVWRGQKK